MGVLSVGASGFGIAIGCNTVWYCAALQAPSRSGATAWVAIGLAAAIAAIAPPANTLRAMARRPCWVERGPGRLTRPWAKGFRKFMII